MVCQYNWSNPWSNRSYWWLIGPIGSLVGLISLICGVIGLISLIVLIDGLIGIIRGLISLMGGLIGLIGGIIGLIRGLIGLISGLTSQVSCIIGLIVGLIGGLIGGLVGLISLICLIGLSSSSHGTPAPLYSYPRKDLPGGISSLTSNIIHSFIVLLYTLINNYLSSHKSKREDNAKKISKKRF